MSAPPDDHPLLWHQLDPERFAHESRRLKNPWNLITEPDGRYAWHGGSLVKRSKGRVTDRRAARLIYPHGYPARFIEARLVPELPQEYWGSYGIHVNSDGSACYINADGWSPQDTVERALSLFEIWWWNYFWIVEQQMPLLWPPKGMVRL